MSISLLTIKIKHNLKIKEHLKKGIEIANFAIKNRDKLSSKYVKNIGLHSSIASQILRKHGRNKKCKKINPKNIKLIIPGQAIKIVDKKIYLVPFRLYLINDSKYQPLKINQAELDENYVYLVFEIQDQNKLDTINNIGVDINSTGHCCVISNPNTGKIIKFGKEILHLKKKYKTLRTSFQKKKLFKKLKETKNKESNKTKDLNNKISRCIVNFAKSNNCGIKLEYLKGIRNNKNKILSNKNERHTLNNWSYYQLQQMIIYKAKLLGIPVYYINPSFTSKNCSRCGQLGRRCGKSFKCEKCKHVDHADVNAAFNIANSPVLINLCKTEITKNGNTDIPIEQCSENLPRLPLQLSNYKNMSDVDCGFNNGK